MPQPFDQSLVRRVGVVWRRQGGLTLCDVCGAREPCKLRTALTTLGETRNAKIVVAECGTYMPVISFQDRTGLEGLFNTFRRGEGWAKRVIKAGKVGLFDLSAGELIGFASVQGFHVGVLRDLLVEHSSANHLMKGLPVEEAPAKLADVLRRAYGRTYAAETETYCVIDLKRDES